jgi:hypothetical protein
MDFPIVPKEPYLRDCTILCGSRSVFLIPYSSDHDFKDEYNAWRWQKIAQSKYLSQVPEGDPDSPRRWASKTTPPGAVDLDTWHQKSFGMFFQFEPESHEYTLKFYPNVHPSASLSENGYLHQSTLNGYSGHTCHWTAGSNPYPSYWDYSSQAASHGYGTGYQDPNTTTDYLSSNAPPVEANVGQHRLAQTEGLSNLRPGSDQTNIASNVIADNNYVQSPAGSILNSTEDLSQHTLWKTTRSEGPEIPSLTLSKIFTGFGPIALEGVNDAASDIQEDTWDRGSVDPDILNSKYQRRASC